MSKSTDIRIVEVTCETQPTAFRAPLKFGGRVVNESTNLCVTCVVETRNGRRGEGLGAMPIGNVWAWPGEAVSSEASFAAMLALGEAAVREASGFRDTGHPLDITRALAADHQQQADKVTQAQGLAEPMPALAQLVATSPLEAAIHDGYGKALGLNSYNTLGPEFANHDLSAYLTEEFLGEYLDLYTLREPKTRMPLYHLVVALDPLTDADITNRINDGLPETLGEWIAADGLTHLKIKLSGEDLQWDIERVIGVEEAAKHAQRARGCGSWKYSVDFNEKCSDVQYVLDFLSQVKRRSPAAFDRIHYIEQPTSRDLKANPENRMHAAAEIKPVVIDESLIDLESLLLCREMGYSGVALKACKGHTEALLMGAAAQKFGMFLCVQDLTCPGRSFLHSASLAARIKTVSAIEGNCAAILPRRQPGLGRTFPQDVRHHRRHSRNRRARRSGPWLLGAVDYSISFASKARCAASYTSFSGTLCASATWRQDSYSGEKLGGAPAIQASLPSIDPQLVVTECGLRSSLCRLTGQRRTPSVVVSRKMMRSMRSAAAA